MPINPSDISRSFAAKVYRAQWELGEAVYNSGDGVETVNQDYAHILEGVMDGYQDAAIGRGFNSPDSCSREHLTAL